MRPVLIELPIRQVVVGASVSSSTVERARAGKLTGNTARAKTVRAKLPAYAIKHADTAESFSR